MVPRYAPTKWQYSTARHFIPLESSPEAFNEWLRSLGLPDDISFEDVYSLDQPEFLLRRALAMILVLPTTDRYDANKTTLEAAHPGTNQLYSLGRPSIMHVRSMLS